MPLAPGVRLGPYEIAAPLGAGGMGEVYRARDTRLDRTVAIKVLPESLASDPQFRERFDREARTISQLDHPHICALHDVGEHDGIAYLVMQYLEGETLAARLAKVSAAKADGAGLPLDEALTIAIAIASALDKAHRAGIVHRDLKPGNVMLTSTGAKLLDFGIAKSHAAVVAGSGLSMLPTTPPSLTAQGAILGTLQYMAPEQLEGKGVDPRTDIFAFGGLVHEMCTGRKAFEAESGAGLIAAILEHQPAAVSSLTPLAPPALDRVVKTCLAKEPDDRWQTARDLLRELKWIGEGRAAAAVTASIEQAVRTGRAADARLAWGVAAVCLLVALGASGLMLWNRAAATASPSVQALARLNLVLPDGARLVSTPFAKLALSPQGTHLVYVAERGGTTQLYLRQMDTFDTRAIPGTEGAMTPFFSPDGQWIGFGADGQLKKVSISGGLPVVLADAPALLGGTWGPNDTIVFAPLDVGLAQVSSSGGPVTSATTLDARTSEGGHLWPEFLPDGKSILFTVGTVGTNMERARIVLHSLEDGQRRVLIQGGTYPRYVRSGHIVYTTAGTLMAVPFDLAMKTVTGPGVPVVDGVAQSWLGAAQFSVSGLGSVAYVPGGVRESERTLVWADRKGTMVPLPLRPRPYWTPRLSPDGLRIAVGIEGPTHDVWVSEVARDTLTRLTFGSDNYWPLWTPDGTRIVFQSNRTGPWNIFWTPVDRSTPDEELVRSEHTVIPHSWSSDGQTLVFSETNRSTALDIGVVSVSGPRTPRPFLHTAAFEDAPAVAPGGRWIAYTSNETGREEVYVRRFPEGGRTQQISTNGGRNPKWARSGRELFYYGGAKLMAVDVESGVEFGYRRPRELFELPPSITPNVPFDVAADGQRFLLIREDNPEPGPTQLNLVQGWFEELKRRAPVK